MALAYGLLLAHAFRNQEVAALSGAAWLGQFWQWVPTAGQAVFDGLFGVMMQGESRYNPVLWTMVIEWRGSLLVLGLLALVGGRSWRLALYAALALGFTLGRLNFYYVAFLLGLSLHDVYRRNWAARLSTSARRLVIAGLLLAAAVSAGHPQIYYRASQAGTFATWLRLPGVSPDRTVQFYHTLGAVALLAAVLLSARLRRLVAVPWLRRVGKRAFSLYITHFLMLGSGSAWLFLWLRGTSPTTPASGA